MSKPIKLGVSRCLLGENVRYNGGHAHDHFLTDTLGQYVEFISICPEVEVGMGIPRETLRLVEDPESPRLVTSKTNKDYTDDMVSWAQKRVQELEKEELCGFIFKSKSPSSGMARVKVYGKGGIPVNKGVGIFAREFMKHFPLLPVEEEGRLHDPKLRENFIEQIFVLQLWRALLKGKKSRQALVDFHTAHKLLIMSHSVKHYNEMGRLVAHAKEYQLPDLYDTYEQLLMQAMRLKTTIKKNVNVLLHIVGYFKKDLTPAEKQELIEIIEQYKKEFVPLVVPVTLLNHYVRKYNKDYLAQQHYLHPHPVELKLRNHV
jgi:uncharacterized protein YbgA (DUF1722 family)/uncharacterized protein YbbK (DUF523 family)